MGHASRYSLVRAWGAVRAFGYEVSADFKVFWDLAHDFDWDFIQPALKTIPIFGAILWDGVSAFNQSIHIRQIAHHFRNTGDLRLLDLLALDFAGMREKDIPPMSGKERQDLERNVKAPLSLTNQFKEFTHGLRQQTINKVSYRLRNFPVKKAAKTAFVAPVVLPAVLACKVAKDVVKLYTLPANLSATAGIVLRHSWEASADGARYASRHLGPFQEVFDRTARPKIENTYDWARLCLGMFEPKKADIPIEELPARTKKRGEKQFRMLSLKNAVNATGIGFQSWFVLDTLDLSAKFAEKVSVGSNDFLRGNANVYEDIEKAYETLPFFEFCTFIIAEKAGPESLSALFGPLLADANAGNAGLYVLTTLLASASLNHMLEYHQYLDRVRHDKIAMQIAQANEQPA